MARRSGNKSRAAGALLILNEITRASLLLGMPESSRYDVADR
jgi:hypothetical protein